MTEPTNAPKSALTRTIVSLGIVSLFTDAASDMIWPLLPLFLVEVLHRSVGFVGLIEGVAEATAAIAKYVTGTYSDRIHRKKPLVLLGYGFSSFARPLLAVATTPWHALGIRFLDRVGKGIRTAPRDALIAADAPPERRATAFGYHRAMDNFGAFLGPLIATAVLYLAPGQYRLLFALSAIPGALALLAIMLLVRDPPTPSDAAGSSAFAKTSSTGPTNRTFRVYLVWVGIFTLANSSDFFLVAKARESGVPAFAIPAVWGGLSILRAAATVPGGWVADRIGKLRALSGGWLLYAVAYGALAFAQTPAALLICLGIYSGYYALTEGAERAVVATLVPRAMLGRAYGLFALVSGGLALPASAMFGGLYGVQSGRVSFLVAAALALTASAALFTWSRGLDVVNRPEAQP